MNFQECRDHIVSRVGTERVYGARPYMTQREVDRLIEDARQRVVRKLIEEGVSDIATESATVDTVVGTVEYTVSYLLFPVQVSVKYTVAGPRRTARNMGKDWNRGSTSDEAYRIGTEGDPAYRRLGKYTIEIYPSPTIAVSDAIKIDYIQDFQPYVSGSTDIGLPEHYCWQIVDMGEWLLRRRLGIEPEAAQGASPTEA